jgi:hypothetical protein
MGYMSSFLHLGALFPQWRASRWRFGKQLLVKSVGILAEGDYLAKKFF